MLFKVSLVVLISVVYVTANVQFKGPVLCPKVSSSELARSKEKFGGFQRSERYHGYGPKNRLDHEDTTSAAKRPSPKRCRAHYINLRTKTKRRAKFNRKTGEVTASLLPGRYEIRYSCVCHTRVSGSVEVNVQKDFRSRRADPAIILPLIVPYLAIDQLYQVIALWDNDGSQARCDFDSALVTSYSPACTVSKADVDPLYGLTGFCFDVDGSYSYLQGDSACPGLEGYEVTDIYEVNTATFSHYMYIQGSAASYVGSQAQVHVYRRDPNGGTAPQKIASSHITNVASYNSDWRFFHTVGFSVDSTNQLYTVTNVDSVTCDPSLSTGSTAAVALEQGQPRNC